MVGSNGTRLQWRTRCDTVDERRWGFEPPSLFAGVQFPSAHQPFSGFQSLALLTRLFFGLLQPPLMVGFLFGANGLEVDRHLRQLNLLVSQCIRFLNLQRPVLLFHRCNTGGQSSNHVQQFRTLL